jgi:hypothetical protein
MIGFGYVADRYNREANAKNREMGIKEHGNYGKDGKM